MARTTSEAVAKIIEVEDGDDLESFIESATIIVDRIEALESPPSELEMELVERWLSAHYYAIYRQRVASEKAGPVSENKQFWVGYGFQTTMHGTQAMTLDSSGTLAAINATVKGNAATTTTKRAGGIHFLGTSGNRVKESETW